MSAIEPNEVEITGKWLMSDGRVVGDASCQRIINLTTNYLIKLGHDWSGWETLYRDPSDGRFWEQTYRQGELQSGGPPQLRCLQEKDAETKYGQIVNWMRQMLDSGPREC